MISGTIAAFFLTGKFPQTGKNFQTVTSSLIDKWLHGSSAHLNKSKPEGIFKT